MSDAPETIWAECSAHKNWDDLNASQYKVEWWQEYRRADLPPTLSAAMELPEVQALVEALEQSTKEWIELAECGDCGFWDVEKMSVVTEARAALAQLKESKL